MRGAWPRADHPGRARLHGVDRLRRRQRQERRLRAGAGGAVDVEVPGLRAEQEVLVEERAAGGGIAAVADQADADAALVGVLVDLVRALGVALAAREDGAALDGRRQLRREGVDDARLRVRHAVAVEHQVVGDGIAVVCGQLHVHRADRRPPVHLLDDAEQLDLRAAHDRRHAHDLRLLDELPRRHPEVELVDVRLLPQRTADAADGLGFGLGNAVRSGSDHGWRSCTSPPGPLSTPWRGGAGASSVRSISERTWSMFCKMASFVKRRKRMQRCFEILLTRAIFFGLLLVNRTVDFDRESALDAVEVNDEPADRMLSPEPPSAEALASQPIPEQCFRRRRLVAHRARDLPLLRPAAAVRGVSRHTHSPRSAPLSTAWRGAGGEVPRSTATPRDLMSAPPLRTSGGAAGSARPGPAVSRADDPPRARSARR